MGAIGSAKGTWRGGFPDSPADIELHGPILCLTLSQLLCARRGSGRTRPIRSYGLHYAPVAGARESDLTGYARIRNAALEGFARNGVAATSIREVAQAAGVSAGLVQHHFGTKEALREAVNDYVVSIALDAFADLGTDAAGEEDVLEDIADRITSMVRDHYLALLYVARSAASDDESALGIFSAFVAIADKQFAALKKAGLLQPDVDMRWASLHVVIINLATVLMEPALNSHLDEPLLDPRQLERWNTASTALIRHGLFALPTANAKNKR